ncbi:hypothetical protein SUGI_1142500 [Cryptomeria japonica]|nr:hypothetical protein SUGI_1142500 [Cryptomeria japonica]
MAGPGTLIFHIFHIFFTGFKSARVSQSSVVTRGMCRSMPTQLSSIMESGTALMGIRRTTVNNSCQQGAPLSIAFKALSTATPCPI